MALRMAAGTMNGADAQRRGGLADDLDHLDEMSGNAQVLCPRRSCFEAEPSKTHARRMRMRADAAGRVTRSMPRLCSVELKSDWIAADGRARVEILPKGNPKDNAAMDRFAAAVQKVVPQATGGPVATRESGNTIIRAFLEAGVLSFVAMVVLLSLALRNVRDIMLTVMPLVLIGVLTFGTCVAARPAAEFRQHHRAAADVRHRRRRFNIYFVMSWRQGSHSFLQSSLTRAVILSALTTASGFGTLWLSKHPGTASMGELLTISLGCTLLVTLFFVPALPCDARQGRR